MENKTNNKTPDLGSVFSLSFTQPTQSINTAEYFSSAKTSIEEILRKEFPGIQSKQEVHDKIGRYNFACPYCGDSATDAWKKRGNLYQEGYTYYCYNCGVYKTLEALLSDHNKEVSTGELVFLREQRDLYEKNSGSNAALDPHIFMQTEYVEKWAIDREVLIRKMGYGEARNTRIETYLRKRLQTDMNKFAWNHTGQKLMILNLTSDGKKVLGFQIRNFKDRPKYLTFKLDMIYTDILEIDLPDDASFDYANSLSITFGIMDIDINKPITVFEGPFDSFLFNNSVAVCSVKNDFPLDLPVRWFFDYDTAGRDAALKRTGSGESVFMWKKFLSENQTGINTTKKIDLTDMLVWIKRKGIQLPTFSNYFSSNKYDMYWI